MCADNRRQSLTNLRVVEDPASATGWSIQVGPFPGWNDGSCRVAGGVANVRLQPSV